MIKEDTYTIVREGKKFAVLREGPSVSEYGSYVGRHSRKEWAIQQARAYIDWLGGTLINTTLEKKKHV